MQRRTSKYLDIIDKDVITFGETIRKIKVIVQSFITVSMGLVYKDADEIDCSDKRINKVLAQLDFRCFSNPLK